MSEFLEFIGRLIDLLLKLLELSNDYTPPRRKRVFSLGFVMFLLCVAVVELILLNVWFAGGG
ncbi:MULTISPECIES: hypothetical protein [unclassified Pseudomonas]|uniref:hypothetical protein n=1 Tax=unclassified Pseudomonas TaxID=196821 RepID=UPI002005D145|nr:MULTISPECIES: hypothetical protein [unclassified Pseudomonas]MCK6189855.1 hypothetical protein [Pseudomonas sp. EYE_354]WLH66781.1 hypothetical protein PSH59_16760 [Pseudomonas sp. FP2309]